MVFFKFQVFLDPPVFILDPLPLMSHFLGKYISSNRHVFLAIKVNQTKILRASTSFYEQLECCLYFVCLKPQRLVKFFETSRKQMLNMRWKWRWRWSHCHQGRQKGWTKLVCEVVSQWEWPLWSFLEFGTLISEDCGGTLQLTGPRKPVIFRFHGVKYCYPFQWPFFERFFLAHLVAMQQQECKMRVQWIHYMAPFPACCMANPIMHASVDG